MVWKILTDVTVALHGLWVVTVVAGPLVAWRHRLFRAVHLGMLWWTFLILASGIYCPVNELENSFRVHYDPGTAYSSGFVVHYVGRMAGWDLTQPQVVTGMVAWAIVWTVLYAFLWTREQRARRTAAATAPTDHP